MAQRRKHHKRNPYSTEQQMKEVIQEIVRNLQPYPFAVVGGHVSTLGGIDKPSILLSTSLDERKTWHNGIYQNSNYANFYIGHNGVMELTHKHYELPTFRKTKIKSVHDIIVKLHVWAEKALIALGRG